MRPGDVVLSKNVRSYCGATILPAGQPEWTKFSAGDGEYLVLLCLGTVPKGAHPEAVKRLHSLGYAPKEGYPNPGRFTVVQFQEECMKAVTLLVDRTKMVCPHCKEDKLNARDDTIAGPLLECLGCLVVHELAPYDSAPNSTTYAMQVVHAMAALGTEVRKVQAGEVPDEHGD